MLFGSVISKLVSRRQEELTEETHRIAFEQRLGRVRTSLHLVLSEFQTLATMCGDQGIPPSVPHGYVAHMTEWMDRIKTLAEHIGDSHIGAN